MKGKLIVIEGTDCSGKETQTTLLVEKLNREGIKAVRLSFPMYDTPTGEIIGACYLGKPHMCKKLLKGENGLFSEGASNVDPYVSINYYAADRRYNKPKIDKLLNEGVNVILDRYVGSNMAHQGGMLKTKSLRKKMFRKIETLEYKINELNKPDMTIFLYVPLNLVNELKKNREEVPDQVESSIDYLKNSERTYLELVELYHYDKIDCSKNGSMRTIEDINEEIIKKVKKLLVNE